MSALANGSIPMPAQFLMEWGEVMRLARRASFLASEAQRQAGRISDPLDGSIFLYTDDPTTACWFKLEPDMAAICKTSAIEGVAILMGESFPKDAWEAGRADPEMPRVAAMWFPPPGTKCPRCRNFTVPGSEELCRPCQTTTTCG